MGSGVTLQLVGRLTIAAVGGLILEQSGTTGASFLLGLRGVVLTTFPSCFYQLFFDSFDDRISLLCEVVLFSLHSPPLQSFFVAFYFLSPVLLFLDFY